MAESALYGEMMLAATERGHRWFRNNTGALHDREGRLVRFGLAPGSSDLIGITSRIVTPAMVGYPVGIFTAIEVKTERGRLTVAQRNFLTTIRQRNGIACHVKTVEEAVQAMESMV